MGRAVSDSQGCRHREMGAEKPRDPPSFSKDDGGHPSAIKQVGVPEKIGSFLLDHLSKVFPICLFLKPSVSKYCWGGRVGHSAVCGRT